jgi:ATP synthase protein I
MAQESPSKRAARFARELALAMELPFVLVGAVLTGGFMGYLLDRWLGTAPLFIVVLGFLGTYAGIREVVRRLPRGDEKHKNGE